MRSTWFTTSAALLVLFAPFLTAPAAGAEPLDEVAIEIVGATGAGCPPGTTAAAMAPGAATFTVAYDQFVVRAGGGVAPIEFRKRCQLTVLIHVPAGYTYAIFRADHSGHASLAAGATAAHGESHLFEGSSGFIFRHTFTGPLEDDWQVSDQPDLPVLHFHPCDTLRNLIIDTDLRVLAGTSDPTTTSVLRTAASDTYYLYWQQCP